MTLEFNLDPSWDAFHYGHGIYIFPKVDLGKNVTLEPGVILGKPPRKTEPGELELTIGDNSTIRSGTIIYAGTTIGNRFNTGHRAMIREDNKIGNDCSVGGGANIEYGNRIGNGTRIHSGCFLERTILGEGVFVGPDVTFTDDPHPICPEYEKCHRLDTESMNNAMGVFVDDFVSIGAKTVLLPGTNVSHHSLVGGGAVVSKDLKFPYFVYSGSPAKPRKRIDQLDCHTKEFEFPYAWRTTEKDIAEALLPHTEELEVLVAEGKLPKQVLDLPFKV